MLTEVQLLRKRERKAARRKHLLAHKRQCMARLGAIEGERVYRVSRCRSIAKSVIRNFRQAKQTYSAYARRQP